MQKQITIQSLRSALITKNNRKRLLKSIIIRQTHQVTAKRTPVAEHSLRLLKNQRHQRWNPNSSKKARPLRLKVLDITIWRNDKNGW